MKICGLDVSMNSPGKCIFDLDDETFDIKTVNFSGFNPTNKRCIKHGNVHIDCVGTKYTSNNIIERINIALEILSKDTEDVKFIAMEGYSFSSAKSNSLFQIGEFTGALKKHFYDKGKGIMIYPPSVIKSFATGSGSAEKNLMKAYFEKDYPHFYPEIINTLPDFESPQSDLIDAFHIAMVLRYHIMFEAKKQVPEEILYKLSKKSSKKVSSILETEMIKKKSN